MFSPQQTRQCPFCAETIQAAAIKCRFCGEFLNTSRAKAIENHQQADSKEQSDGILFTGRPSLWAMAGTAIRGLIFLGLAVLLMRYPIENLSVFQSDKTVVSSEHTEISGDHTEPAEEFAAPKAEVPAAAASGLTQQQREVFGRYRVAAGAALAGLVVFILLLKAVRLKLTCYEVTADRIEWSRGILDRKVDNLDMFRVVDLRLRRNLLDCIFGIGTVSLETTDKTDPQFTFRKVRHSRQLYDTIKKASMEADRRNSVVHLE